MNKIIERFRYGCGAAVCLVFAFSISTPAQSKSSPSQTDADASIETKISALSSSLDETRTELAESREEIKQLRAVLEKVSQKLNTTGMAAATEQTAVLTPAQAASADDQAETAGPQTGTGAARRTQAAISQDDWDVINSRVDQLLQTKVESGSKFPLRLSGMFLLNSIVTSGRVDDFDLPTTAVQGTTPGGSTGFSLRQSIIGVEGHGPEILGAATSGDVQADFYGGMPYGYEASASGLMRLRMARLRMDWKNTSIIGGLDTPFFSPDSPTSYLTVAAPSFSGAGNLWTWSAGVRVEQRFNTRLSQFRAEVGLLDNPSYVMPTSGARLPTFAEASRKPAYVVRLSANGGSDDRPYSLGVSGIYLTERFPGAVKISGGGGSVDWKFPLIPHTELSGEVFAGKGLDGFGALPVPVITTTNYTQYITQTATYLARIGEYGGWSQLKFRANSRNEFNFVAGGGSRDSGAFRQSAATDSIVGGLAFKNESVMVNYVYRPRSDLVFSGEYRRLRTYLISGTTVGAGETGISAGFIF
jgi:hypothetical protein